MQQSSGPPSNSSFAETISLYPEKDRMKDSVGFRRRTLGSLPFPVP